MPKRPTIYDLILFQGRGANNHIHRTAVDKIKRKLDQVIVTPPDRTEIDIWIDSPGGDAHAAYKLGLDLRSRAKKLRAVIPDFAKSAATLIVLGVDEIYMAAGAELGPLDVQIRHPDRENKTISGLDLAGSLDYLGEFSMELAILGSASIVQYTGLTRSEVLDATLRFTAQLLRPCVEKIDPHLTRRAVYQLKVAERYAAALLDLRALPSHQKMSKGDAKNLVRRLVNEYPVHEFVISRDEALAIGLPVENIETYSHWSLVKQVHEGFSKSGGTIIEVLKRSVAGKKPKKGTGKKKGAANEKTDGTKSE